MNIREWFLPANQLKIAHRLWTVRIALAGAILDGLYIAVPAFQYYVPPWGFATICIGVSLSLFVARLTNQTGIDF